MIVISITLAICAAGAAAGVLGWGIGMATNKSFPEHNAPGAIVCALAVIAWAIAALALK